MLRNRCVVSLAARCSAAWCVPARAGGLVGAAVFALPCMTTVLAVSASPDGDDDDDEEVIARELAALGPLTHAELQGELDDLDAVSADDVLGEPDDADSAEAASSGHDAVTEAWSKLKYALAERHQQVSMLSRSIAEVRSLASSVVVNHRSDTASDHATSPTASSPASPSSRAPALSSGTPATVAGLALISDQDVDFKKADRSSLLASLLPERRVMEEQREMLFSQARRDHEARQAQLEQLHASRRQEMHAAAAAEAARIREVRAEAEARIAQLKQQQEQAIQRLEQQVKAEQLEQEQQLIQLRKEQDEAARCATERRETEELARRQEEAREQQEAERRKAFAQRLAEIMAKEEQQRQEQARRARLAADMRRLREQELAREQQELAEAQAREEQRKLEEQERRRQLEQQEQERRSAQQLAQQREQEAMALRREQEAVHREQYRLLQQQQQQDEEDESCWPRHRAPCTLSSVLGQTDVPTVDVFAAIPPLPSQQPEASPSAQHLWLLPLQLCDPVRTADSVADQVRAVIQACRDFDSNVVQAKCGYAPLPTAALPSTLVPPSSWVAGLPSVQACARGGGGGDRGSTDDSDLVSIDAVRTASEEQLSRATSISLSLEDVDSLASLRLSTCTALQSITLTANKLSSIAALPEMPSLQVLELQDNLITCLSPVLASCSALCNLSVNMNNLSSLSYCLPSGLRDLQASMNQLTSLDGVQHCSRLQRLAVYRNKLTSTAGHLQEMPCLLTLDLGRNQLSCFDGEDIAASRLLRVLVLYENRLTAAPQNLNTPLLQELWLNGNKLSTLALSGNLVMLQYLDVSDNNIVEIAPLTACPALRSVNLAFNAIARLQDIAALAPCRMLSSLRVNDNPVAAHPHYRRTILLLWPGLQELDDLPLAGSTVPEDEWAAYMAQHAPEHVIATLQQRTAAIAADASLPSLTATSAWPWSWRCAALSQQAVLPSDSLLHELHQHVRRCSTAYAAGLRCVNSIAASAVSLAASAAAMSDVALFMARGMLADMCRLGAGSRPHDCVPQHVDARYLVQRRKQQQEAASRIQRSWRHLQQRCAARHRAAVSIQATWRGTRWRHSAGYGEIRRRAARRCVAAVCVQAWWRGVSWRCRLHQALEKARYVDDDPFQYDGIDINREEWMQMPKFLDPQQPDHQSWIDLDLADASIEASAMDPASFSQRQTSEGELQVHPRGLDVIWAQLQVPAAIVPAAPVPCGNTPGLQDAEGNTSRGLPGADAGQQHAGEDDDMQGGEHTRDGGTNDADIPDDDSDVAQEQDGSNAESQQGTIEAKPSQLADAWGITNPATLAALQRKQARYRRLASAADTRRRQADPSHRIQRFRRVRASAAHAPPSPPPSAARSRRPAWASPSVPNRADAVPDRQPVIEQLDLVSVGSLGSHSSSSRPSRQSGRSSQLATHRDVVHALAGRSKAERPAFTLPRVQIAPGGQTHLTTRRPG